jgi:hypothetical protein
MEFAYIHCWTTDVFSIGPPRNYISIPVVEGEREWSEPSAGTEGGFKCFKYDHIILGQPSRLYRIVLYIVAIVHGGGEYFSKLVLLKGRKS